VAAALPITLLENHFPFFSRGRIKKITAVSLYAEGALGDVSLADDAQGTNSCRMTAVSGLPNAVMGKVNNIQIKTPDW